MSMRVKWNENESSLFVPPLDETKWLSVPLSSFAWTNFSILHAKLLSRLTGLKEHPTSLKRFLVSSLLLFFSLNSLWKMGLFRFFFFLFSVVMLFCHTFCCLSLNVIWKGWQESPCEKIMNPFANFACPSSNEKNSVIFSCFCQTECSYSQTSAWRNNRSHSPQCIWASWTRRTLHFG